MGEFNLTLLGHHHHHHWGPVNLCDHDDDDYTDNSLVWILLLCLLIPFRALLLLCGVLTCPIPGIITTTTSLRTRPFVRHRHHVGTWCERVREILLPMYLSGAYILKCWGHQNRAEQLIPWRCVGGEPNPALSQSKREYLWRMIWFPRIYKGGYVVMDCW